MIYKHFPILAIDPAQNMGWAFYNCDTKNIQFGSMFLEGDIRGERFMKFEETIESVVHDVGMDGDKRLLMVLEQPTLTNGNSLQQLKYSLGWHAVAETWAAKKKLPEPRPAPVPSWRKIYFPTTKPRELTGAEGSKWYKRESLKQAQRHGFDPKNDNESDALAILYFALHGGLDHLDAIKKEKADKAALKRAQPMLMAMPKMEKPKK